MTSAPIDLVVLAGGAATRLGGMAAGLPKALLPVAEKPFLHHPLTRLASTVNLGKTIISTRAGSRMEFKHYLNKTVYNIDIIEEKVRMGTGGAILSALAMEGLSNPFLVMNGDVLFAMDGSAVARAAIEKGAALAVIEVPDAGRFGAVTVKQGTVDRFSEKNADAGAALISAGLYAFTHESLAGFDYGPCSFEHDIAPVLAARGTLAAVEAFGPFIDIGTPESLQNADSFVRAMQRV